MSYSTVWVDGWVGNVKLTNTAEAGVKALAEFGNITNQASVESGVEALVEFGNTSKNP